MANIQQQIEIEDDRRMIQRRVLIMRVLNGLQCTIQLRGIKPETPVDDVRVDFTDESAKFIAPLVEAVEILEAIIFASGGCVGHRQCAHSIEPWQRARALFEDKWRSDNDPNLPRWPETRVHGPRCYCNDCYSGRVVRGEE
jgi:hypothetical protein